MKLSAEYISRINNQAANSAVCCGIRCKFYDNKNPEPGPNARCKSNTLCFRMAATKRSPDIMLREAAKLVEYMVYKSFTPKDILTLNSDLITKTCHNMRCPFLHIPDKNANPQRPTCTDGYTICPIRAAALKKTKEYVKKQAKKIR